MKRFLVLALVLVFIAAVFVACAPSPEVPNDSSAPETTDAPVETEAPETTIDPKRRPVAWASIKFKDLGMQVLTVDNPNLYSVDTRIKGNEVALAAYADGVTTLSFTDHFGHKASADVTVSGETVELVIHPAEDFIDVNLDFGARGDGSTNCTSAFQAAIDSAKPGETVYVYPGIYLIDTISMREGVTLELYTTMTDAHTGFTDELAKDVKEGRAAVILKGRIMNNTHHQPAIEGCSNFTVRGGVFDMAATGKGAFIFGAAEGVTLENIILKDISNDHAIQITGCTDVTIRNCMFAGYSWGGTFTREVLQVEVSAIGATGDPETAPLTFKNGEFYYSENVEISHCYFGRSDEQGSPLMAIGHHSQAGKATVTGFRIKDNIFNEVRYAAIRYTNIVDTEISGNTFITTASCKNVKHEDATTPAFIIIYSNSANTTYKSAISGERVTCATQYEQSGTHGLVIKNNQFKIGAGADKKVIHIGGTDFVPGAIYQTGLFRQDFYNTETYSYSGYSYLSNCVEGLVFSDNTISFEGQPAYKDNFAALLNVHGFTYENNTVNMPESVTFDHKDQGIVGLLATGSTVGSHAEKYIIKTGTDGTLTLGNTAVTASGNFTVNINVEGEGYIAVTDDRHGNATMSPMPMEGYLFDGFYDESGTRLGGAVKVESNTSWTAKFIKK